MIIEEYIDFIKSLDLEKEIEDKVLDGNARGIYKLPLLLTCQEAIKTLVYI